MPNGSPARPAMVALRSVSVVTLLAAAHLALAQAKDEPKRPRLPADADTNSASTYYAYGRAQLERDPAAAADAFYWATRIDPLMPESYYGRRWALLLTDKGRFQRYMEDDRRTLESDEIKRVDSLFYYALTIDPFMYRGLDALLFRSYLNTLADDYLRRNNVNIQYDINRWLMQQPTSFKAWKAYGDGNLNEALKYYADAIRDARFKAELRAERGRLFFLVRQPDSALTELTQSVDELRKADKKDIVYVYESKALLEHSIGIVQQSLGNRAAAKEAFARALEEDLSYFPAHLQLANLAMSVNDTATAMSELDLAVQIRPNDPRLRFADGYALISTGKFEEADAQFRKAIEVDPFFASPYLMLALVLDSEGKAHEALAYYRAFLTHASQTDPRRKEAEEHVRELAKDAGEIDA